LRKPSNARPFGPPDRSPPLFCGTPWSAVWLTERGRDYANFEWRGGYADFAVSQSNLEQLKQYIA
jgi:hypothetical protein